MPPLFSRSCEYAIQAMLYLSSRETDAPILARDISRALGIPHHYLTKVLHLLARDHILSSHRGSGGGFTIARPSAQITLHDIVSAIDGRSFLEDCVLGFTNCSQGQPCPVHVPWSAAKATILSLLDTNTLSQLGKQFDAAPHSNSITSRRTRHDYSSPTTSRPSR